MFVGENEGVHTHSLRVHTHSHPPTPISVPPLTLRHITMWTRCVPYQEPEEWIFTTHECTFTTQECTFAHSQTYCDVSLIRRQKHVHLLHENVLYYTRMYIYHTVLAPRYVLEYSLLDLECHFFNLKSQSMI
jgi:hypothetical protein